MQQRISQWLERLGMEFSDVMSLTMVIGLILLISCDDPSGAYTV